MVFNKKKKECEHQWRELRRSKKDIKIVDDSYTHKEGNKTITETYYKENRTEVVIEMFCTKCGMMKAKLEIYH